MDDWPLIRSCCPRAGDGHELHRHAHPDDAAGRGWRRLSGDGARAGLQHLDHMRESGWVYMRDGREKVDSTFVQVVCWARRGAGRAMTGWAGCGAACWWRGCRRPPWWPWSRSASPPPSPAAAPGAGRRDCCRAPPSRATAPSTTTSSVCRTVVLLPGVSSLCHTDTDNIDYRL